MKENKPNIRTRFLYEESLKRQKFISIIFIVLGFIGTSIDFYYLSKSNDSQLDIQEILLLALLVVGLSLIINGVGGLLEVWKRTKK
jgi:hypothetical protein